MIAETLLFTLFLLLPFACVGIINRVKALWAGRKGSSIVQPYFDFFKLLKKGEVLSTTTTYITRIAPSLNVAAVIFAFLFVPLPTGKALVSFEGDFLLFLYALGLARFMMILAALDTGSSFEGMGGSREATFAVFIEVGIVILLATLVLATGEYSMAAMFGEFRAHGEFAILVRLLFVAALFVLLLAEGSRVPVDDPNTHLELTMIHEVMILDISGPALAFTHYAIALKMLMFSMLLAHVCVPATVGAETGIILFFLVVTGVFVSVGVVESAIARSRLSHVPQFLFLIAALSITAFAVMTFFLRGGVL